MISLISSKAFRFALLVAGSLLAVFSCNLSNENGHTYMNVARDSAWDAFDSLEISWRDSVSGNEGILFQGNPGKLETINKLLAEGYQGQGIVISYKGFKGGSLVSEVQQKFDPSTPTVVDLDTVQSPLFVTEKTQDIKGLPPRVTVMDTFAVSIHDSVTFIALATLDSGALKSFTFDYDGDGKTDDSISLTGLSAEIRGGYRFHAPATYTARLRVRSADDTDTVTTTRVHVLKDEPTADAGKEQTVFTGDTVRLTGTGKDGLGEVKRMEWKIGAAEFAETPDGAYWFTAPALPGNLAAIFRVTDDDTQSVVSAVLIHVVARAQPTLTDLRVSAGTLSPKFNPLDTAYVDTLPYTAGVIAVTPMANGTITVNGDTVTSGKVSRELSLIVGGNPVLIAVGLPGVPDKIYRLNVVRLPASGNMTLSALTLSAGTLAPKFNAQNTSYTASVAHEVASLTLTPALADSVSSLTMNGTATPSGIPVKVDLVVGVNILSLVVTAQDGSKNTYTVQVTRAGDGNADLAGLVVSAGSLNPTFDPAKIAYTVTAPNDSTTVVLKPTTAAATSALKVNGINLVSGQASPAIPIGSGANVFLIVVTAQDGTTQKTYTVTVNRAGSSNADLSNLVLSSGALTPVFASGTISYSASVSNATASVTVTPTTAGVGAAITVNGSVVSSGSASSSINLSVGSNAISTVVTAQDGATQKTYTVKVNRAGGSNADLSNLVLSSGTLTPAFASGTISYSASVSNATTSVTVTPTAAGVGASITVNGGGVTSGIDSPPIALNVGNNTLSVDLTAQDGLTQKTYTVTVNRAPSSNSDLSSLTLSSGAISPVFSSGTTSYTASVSNATTSVTVTPTATGVGASIMVNGGAVTSGSASSPIALTVGNNTITSTVTAQDGTTRKTYTVVVTRAPSANAVLSSLSASAGILSPAFSSSAADYVIVCANAISTTTITPGAADPAATIRVNGSVVASGAESVGIPLIVGENPISIQVTAQDGVTIKNYSISVTRLSSNADLSGLAASAVTLSPAFSPATTSYTASCPNTISSTTITPTLADANATVSVNGIALASGTASIPISLAAGDNVVSIKVAAQDKTEKTYTITINRAFNLNGTWSGLTSQGLTMSFQVVNNAITWVSYDFEFDNGCVSGSSGSKTTFGTPVAIVSNAFTFTSPSLPLRSFSGLFSSEGAANGNLRHTFTDQFCGIVTTLVTWTSTKSAQ